MSDVTRVEAVPPSLVYRLKKAYRRNRAAVLVSTAFTALIVSAAIVGGVLAFQARRAKALAEAKRIEAEEQRAYAETQQERAMKLSTMHLEAMLDAILQAASSRIDADLLEYKSDPRVGLLRLAKSLDTSTGVMNLGEDIDGGTLRISGSIDEMPEFVKLREFQAAAVITAGQQFVPLVPPLDPTISNQTSRDERFFLAGNERTGMELLAIPSLKRIGILREGSERLVNWGFSPDSQTCWTQDTDSVVRFWNTDGTFRVKTPLRPERFIYPAGMATEEVRYVAPYANYVDVKDGVALVQSRTPLKGKSGSSRYDWDINAGVLRLGNPGPLVSCENLEQGNPYWNPLVSELDGNLIRCGWVLTDANTFQRLKPPLGRKYAPELAKLAQDGRFFEDLDTGTEKRLPIGHYRLINNTVDMASYLNGTNLFETTYEPELRFRPNAKRLSIPPAMLELWAHVVTGGELGTDGRFLPWDEPTWEAKQKQLAAMKPPYDDFPFPGWVTQDPHLWWWIQTRHLNGGGKEWDRLMDEWRRRSGRALLDLGPDPWRTPCLYPHFKASKTKIRCFSCSCSVRRTVLVLVIDWVGDSITSTSTISLSTSTKDVGKDKGALPGQTHPVKDRNQPLRKTPQYLMPQTSSRSCISPPVGLPDWSVAAVVATARKDPSGRLHLSPVLPNTDWARCRAE